MSLTLRTVIRDRYQVLHCISPGKQEDSASVWLVKDNQLSEYLCLKMYSKIRPYPPPCGCPTEASLLRVSDGETHPGFSVLPRVFDEFTVEAADGSGTHACMVSTLYGQDVSIFSPPQRVSLPWNVAKQAAFRILLGLDYLHRVKGIVHGDIKIDNVLLALPEDHNACIESFLAMLDPLQANQGPITTPVADMEMLDICLVDLDLAHHVSNSASHSFIIQPQALRAPEVILGAPWSTPADIWNVGCLIYEMVTSRSLMRPIPTNHDEHSQLARMVRLLGDFPPELIAAGSPLAREYFTAEEHFESPTEERVPLDQLIVHSLLHADDRPDHPGLSIQEIGLFSDFLCSMIRLRPEERATAMDLLSHPWFHDYLNRILKKMESQIGPDGQ